MARDELWARLREPGPFDPPPRPKLRVVLSVELPSEHDGHLDLSSVPLTPEAAIRVIQAIAFNVDAQAAENR